jgi:photosystem II stability/assembly factor-like uncharacterized protein
MTQNADRHIKETTVVEKSKSSLTRVLNFIPQVMPIIIIGGLLYAGFFVKAEAVITKVEPKAIERRDNFISVAAPSDQVAWAAGTAGKVVRTEDGGKTLENIQGITAFDDKSAIIVGNHSLILYTTDAGATWSQATQPTPPKPEISKLFRVQIAGNTVWAVGEYNTLLRSDDKGVTWTRVLPEMDRNLNTIAFAGNVGIIFGEAGVTLRSTDGGATWEEIKVDNLVSLMNVAFRDEQHGVAVGLTGTMMATEDAGATWRSIPMVTEEHLLNVRWEDNQWIAVGDKGVIVTSNGEAKEWKAGKIFEGDVAWRTQMVKQGPRYYVVGANLAILEDGKLAVAGR